MTKYRVRLTGDGGWVVELLDGIPVILGGQRMMEPEWLKASGPFSSQQEAEEEMARLKAER